MTVRRQSRSSPNGTPARRKAATTPEAREIQLIAKAERLAEQQMEDGTASAQVITHYLKLGSTRERLEQERLKGEVELQKAKMENLASARRVEELYAKAIEAMRSYGGNVPEATVDDEE